MAGDALLTFDEASEGGPTGVAAVGAQAGSDELDELVGDDGDEQVAVGASRLAVVDGSQAEFGLERTEDGFDVGERGVGAPERVFVPVGLAAAQAVDAGPAFETTFRGLPAGHSRRAFEPRSPDGARSWSPTSNLFLGSGPRRSMARMPSTSPAASSSEEPRLSSNNCGRRTASTSRSSTSS